MDYIVWHARSPTFGLTARRFPAEFRDVAVVDCSSLEEAYILTNNLTCAWTKNAEVTPRSEGLRSTSVGDVIVDPNGVAHAVADIGFVELGPYAKGVHLMSPARQAIDTTASTQS